MAPIHAINRNCNMYKVDFHSNGHEMVVVPGGPAFVCLIKMPRETREHTIHQ